MLSKTAVAVGFLTALTGATLFAGEKAGVSFSRIGEIPEKNLYLAPSLASADTCFVTDNQEITMRIDGWVIGFELYKSLMNPANNCSNPYPFTITAINMPMIFDAPTPITIAVDVEAVDNTTIPGCPVPGVLLAVSSQWEAQIPEAGLYNIWVPLDEPLVVDGPFFAGFYIGNTFEPAVNAAVLVDDFPAPCATYNIWDETIGWIDLANNDYYDFPGRLAMETAGIPGGYAGAQVELLTPGDGDTLYASQELWAWDRQITGEVDYIMFEYSSDGSFVEIGRDFDGASPLRDGVNSVVGANGFSLNWDFSHLPEGFYDLRATLADTLGVSHSDTINVYLEPTPPIAAIIAPGNLEPFCTPVDIDMTTTDENLSLVEVQHRWAEIEVDLGAVAFNQSLVGDADGDPNDGNGASQGEFGDYYSAPVAAAIGADIWAGRGYDELISQGSTTLTTAEVAEGLASAFRTRQTLGTYDEAVFAGLRAYAADHGDAFVFDMKRRPDYVDVRIWVEDEERVVLLGLSGSPGMWLTADGFTSFSRPDGTFQVSVANPLSGNIESVLWNDLTSFSEIMISGVWHPIDLMISMQPAARTVTRTVVGTDVTGQDGWSVHWQPAALIDYTYHYLRSVGYDHDDNVGEAAIMAQYNCALVFVPGDYDDDRQTSLTDLVHLIEFISRQGPEPYGGAERADCNCDNVVNVADIIYYMNYLYGAASPPCR